MGSNIDSPLRRSVGSILGVDRWKGKIQGRRDFDDENWPSPAERLNQHRDHERWLQNQLIFAALGGHGCSLPQDAFLPEHGRAPGHHCAVRPRFHNFVSNLFADG